MRIRANPRKDKKIFARTGAKTKMVNIADRTYRGGIRF